MSPAKILKKDGSLNHGWTKVRKNYRPSWGEMAAAAFRDSIDCPVGVAPPKYLVTGSRGSRLGSMRIGEDSITRARLLAKEIVDKGECRTVLIYRCTNKVTVNKSREVLPIYEQIERCAIDRVTDAPKIETVKA